MLRITELLVISSCFPSFLYCLSGIANGSISEKCEYPVIHSAFFVDPGFVEPHLNFVNSNENSCGLMEFPYQSIMMNCSAPYPIEWVTNIPQHYYYSYILDDEVRTFDRIIDSKSQQKFTVRLHIGNETLVNSSLSSVLCQEVVHYESEMGMMKSCGKTVVSIQRNDRNGKAFIQVKFEAVAKEANESLEFDRESLMTQAQGLTLTCAHESQTQGQIDGGLMCKNESSTYLQTLGSNYFLSKPECSLKENSTSVQIQFNTSELNLPSGALRCNARNNSDDEIIIPYFFSLPQLCPQEDSTLPHLYLQGINPIQEEEFVSICITNVNNTHDIYVGDTLDVTCTSSLYFFSRGMRIYEILKSNNTQKQEDFLLNETSVEYAHGPKGYRTLSISITINSEALHGLECKAPVRKSTRWITKKMRFKAKEPVNLSFIGGSDSVPILSSSSEDFDRKDKFLLCNATGDPLPTLNWSRLYNGILPQNQNNTIHLSLNTPTQSWTASKLYLPNNNDNSKHNLSDFYGRYICTARNKFESLEKIFIFENSLVDSSYGSIPNLVGIGTLIVIAICAVIIIGVLMTLKIQQQSRKLRLFTKAEIDDFVFGKPELLLDDSDSYENINCYATYLPYNRSQFEIQRDHLEFDIKDVLGSGAYGTVYKGFLKSEAEEQTVPVAIKTVHTSSDKMYFTALLSEVKMMCYVGKHENIVNFIGACTQFLELRQIYVVMEYCENGDLLSYLHKNRSQFEAGYKKAMLAFFDLETPPAPAKKIDSSATSTNKPLPNGYCRFNYGNPSRRQLVAWGLQIANGMVFLSSKKVIHGDLAARNILLTSDLKPKIGDFGLSSQLYNYANYVRKGDDLVPWRWLAIECLQYMKFSIKSDVWAFGIILYEIFSIGQVPYPASSYSDEFVFSLIQGERLKRPIYATNKVYELMLSCWKYNPDDRPTFLSLQNTLNSWMGEPIENLIFVDNSYENLKKKEIPCETNGKVKQDRFDETSPKVTNKAINDFPSPEISCKNTQSDQHQQLRGYVDWNVV